LLVFPNCKINLGLTILDKRTDGYHNLETVFYPLPLQDILEIIPQTNNSITSPVQFTSSGIAIDGSLQQNLCVQAYHLLKKSFTNLPHIQMHLHKAIPMGAGLGGGSADAACTLQLINKKFQLNLSNTQLINFALQLGSDCPFFIQNTPSYATSRGEVLTPIQLSLKGHTIIIVNPGIHVPTSWAFAALATLKNNKIHNNKPPLLQAINLPIVEWKNHIVNDFELPIFKQYPAIQMIKETLYQSGALYAAMSGSGSSVFAIFKNDEVPTIKFPANYFVFNTSL
jgi:4-diphosphocytidyl-2-C-methyl-D-erythritol kinase